MNISLIDALKGSKHYKLTGKIQPLHSLWSYYYIHGDSNTAVCAEKIKQFPGKFILDSGAYTWQASVLGKGAKAPGNEEMLKFIKDYSNYIKQNNITDYFELDIEEAVGWKRYHYYRQLLEDSTGIAPRMVWHIHRGDEWLYKYGPDPNYPRLAVGGIVANYALRGIKEYEKTILLPRAIEIMRSYGKEVHGLGITGDWFVKSCNCTSVDTISWLSGVLYAGRANYFDGHSLLSINEPKRDETWQEHALRDFLNWYDYACSLAPIP